MIGEKTLSDCLAYMDAHEKGGAMGVKMLKTNGDFALESRRGTPTPFTAFCKMTGLCRRFPKSKIFGKYYMQYLDKDQPNEIEIVSGAFMLVRRSVWQQVGGLDEDYFMYGEDIDLSYRILKGGFQNYYLPVPILHYKGESTQKSSFRYVYVFYEAMLVFFRKNFSNYNVLISLPIKLAIFLAAIFAFVRMKLNKWFGKNDDALAYLKEKTFALYEEGGDETEIRQILDNYGVNVANAQESADYVVVNAEKTSFSEILSFLERNKCKNQQIATFYPSIGCIITGNYIYLKNFQITNQTQKTRK